MSRHIEWVSADSPIWIAPQGTDLGGSTVDAELAVVIADDDGVAVEGSFENLQRFATRLTRTLALWKATS